MVLRLLNTSSLPLATFHVLTEVVSHASSSPSTLTPATFEMERLLVTVLPLSENPPLLNVIEGTSRPATSLTFVWRVVPLNVNGLPLATAMPLQLSAVDQLSSVPPPFHTRSGGGGGA